MRENVNSLRSSVNSLEWRRSKVLELSSQGHSQPEIARNINNDNDNGHRTVTTMTDTKTVLQALALINDCNKYKMDMTTNSVVITDAIKFVQGQMDHLNIQGKKLLLDIKQDKAEAEQKDIEQEKTTNEIF